MGEETNAPAVLLAELERLRRRGARGRERRCSGLRGEGGDAASEEGEGEEEGQAIALEKALELARQEQEAQEADVVYQLLRRDPYAAVGVDLEHFRNRPRRGGNPTEAQLKSVQKSGLPSKLLDGYSASQVDELREHLLERKAVGLCTPKQAKKLLALGLDPRDMYYDEAKEVLREAKGAR